MGHYLSMSRFVRTLSKIIFEPGELMVDSVKDIDKNKIAILLTETQLTFTTYFNKNDHLVKNGPKWVICPKMTIQNGPLLTNLWKCLIRRYHIIDHDIDRGLYYGRVHMAYNFLWTLN